MTNNCQKVKIGILVALRQELRTLTKERIPIGTCLSLNDNLFIVLSGIGEKAAYSGGKILLEKEVEALISWGSAAALDPKLVAGSLIIPEKIMTKNGKVFNANTSLRNSILQQLDPKTKVYSKPLYGSATLLSTTFQKKTLFQKTGAIAADMESAGLAKLAKKHRLPFVALRAIADTVQMRIPPAIANSFNAQGKLNLFKFIIQLILNPADWQAVFQLSTGFKKANKSLASLAGKLKNQVEMSLHE